MDNIKIPKATYIRRGATKEVLNRHPDWSWISAQDCSVHTLAAIIESLTSTSKDEREYGKKCVRELVKLGKEVEE